MTKIGRQNMFYKNSVHMKKQIKEEIPKKLKKLGKKEQFVIRGGDEGDGETIDPKGKGN